MANCPFCRKYFSKKQPCLDHMNQYHAKQLDDSNMDAAQMLYYSTHGTIHGKCMCGCGKDTDWNPLTGKPYKVSNDPKCRERLSSQADKNMMRVYGKTTLLDDMEFQKKMEQNRPTAGKYTFLDGGSVGFLSKPEEKFLKFCDEILEFTSNMVQESPEQFKYYDNRAGRDRMYIPDFYLPDYNLLVEIKDGGDHPNTNPAFIEETKYKVYLKDEVMRKQDKYNFIKIVDSNFGPFVEALYKIVHDPNKNENVKNRKKLVVITESACMDPDEEMDFMNPMDEEIHDCYLIMVVEPITNMVIGYGFSESDRLARIYFTNYETNSIQEISYLDPIFAGKDIFVYKYMKDGKRDKCLFDMMKLMITQCINGMNSQDDLSWDLRIMLHRAGIHFYCSYMNTDDRRMDFTLVEKYHGEEELE